MNDRLFDLAGLMACELCNLYLTDPGVCKSILYGKLQSLLFEGLMAVHADATERVLEPSRN